MLSFTRSGTKVAKSNVGKSYNFLSTAMGKTVDMRKTHQKILNISQSDDRNNGGGSKLNHILRLRGTDFNRN